MWSRILYLDQSSLFFIWPAFVGKRNHFVFGVAWWHSQQVWRKWLQTPYTPVITITQCWYNVEPASQTMAQRSTNIGWMCRVYYRHTCKFLRSPRILIQHLFNFGVTSDESKSIFTSMGSVLNREYRIHYFNGITWWDKLLRIVNILSSAVRIGDDLVAAVIPANTRRWTNAGLMLGQRRRRWANINPAMVQRLGIAFIMLQTFSSLRPTTTKHWPNVGSVS